MKSRSCLDLLRALYKHLVIEKIQCEMSKYKHEVPCDNIATHITYTWLIHCVHIMCERTQCIYIMCDFQLKCPIALLLLVSVLVNWQLKIKLIYYIYSGASVDK